MKALIALVAILGAIALGGLLVMGITDAFELGVSYFQATMVSLLGWLWMILTGSASYRDRD